MLFIMILFLPFMALSRLFCWVGDLGASGGPPFGGDMSIYSGLRLKRGQIGLLKGIC